MCSEQAAPGSGRSDWSEFLCMCGIIFYILVYAGRG